jgi:hypothetical protein
METVVVGAASAVPIEVVKLSYRQAAWRLANKPVELAKQSWMWIAQKTNPFMTGYVRPAFGWARAMLSRIAGVIGWQGGAGMGLVLVSTDRGRSLLDNTVGSAVRTVGRVIRWFYRKGHSAMEHLWAPGRAVNKATDWAIEGVNKGINRTKKFYNEHLERYLDVDSVQMNLTKTFGFALIGFRIAALIPNPIVAGLVGFVVAVYVVIELINAAGLSGLLGEEIQEEWARQTWIRANEKKARLAAKVAEKAAKVAEREAKKASDKAAKAPATATQVTVKPRRTRRTKEQIAQDNKRKTRNNADGSRSNTLTTV